MNPRTALRSPAILGVLALAVALLGARPASACRSNEECKSPRICAMGTCVNPPASTAARCERDIDCGGEDVCESNRCVPIMSKMPGESAPPPTQPLNNPNAGNPPPGLEITPHTPDANTPEVAPPQPAPTTPPPPPPSRPPRPRPDAVIVPPAEPPPPPPPPPYGVRRPRPIMPARFDAFLGAGFLFTQNEFRAASALGIGVDAQFLVGVAPEVALGVRAGGIIEPAPSIFQSSLFYAAPGIYMPMWHWGLFIGYANGAASPKDPRLSGVAIEVPYEYSFAPYLKLGIVFGLGVFPEAHTSMGEQNFRVELGF